MANNFDFNMSAEEENKLLGIEEANFIPADSFNNVTLIHGLTPYHQVIFAYTHRIHGLSQIRPNLQQVPKICVIHHAWLSHDYRFMKVTRHVMLPLPTGQNRPCNLSRIGEFCKMGRGRALGWGRCYVWPL